MNAEGKSGRHDRKPLQAAIGIGLVVLFVWLAWYLASPRFNERVRRVVVARLENVTGGHVEVEHLHWNLSKLELEARNLTIHGLEASGEVPYAHIDRLFIRLKILSLFSGDIGLRYLSADRPVLHIIVDPNGKTNQPLPKIKSSNKTLVQKLFDFDAERMELNNGEILWNDRPLPMDLTADEVFARLVYVPSAHRFEGSIKIGKLDTKVRDFRSFASSLETQFSLTQTDARINVLSWKAGASRLNASGRVRDFGKPTVDVVYDLALDLQQAGAVARTAEMRSGKLEIQGAGSASSQEFASTGKVFLRDVYWNSSTLRAPNIRVQAGFSVNKNLLALTHLTGTSFGGSFAGGAEIRNWMSSHGGRPDRAAAEQIGSALVQLRFDNLQLRDLAAAISSASMPLERLNPVGAASGNVEISWHGKPQNMQVTLATEALPPAQVPSGGLPVKGAVRGTYSFADRRAEITEANLMTRAGIATVSGNLGSEKSRLLVDLRTSDLGEFRPALTSTQMRQIPIDLRGSASFSGILSGKLTAPTLKGHAEFANFDSILPLEQAPAATPFVQRPTRRRVAAGGPAGPATIYRMHWDRFSADVQLSAASLVVRDGTLARGNTKINFQATAALHKYKMRPADPFSARLSVVNAALADVQQLAGTDYPLTGTLDLNGQIAGTQQDPQGQASFQLSNGSVYAEPFRSFRADLRFAQRTAQLQNVVLVFNGASLSGWSTYNLADTSLHFDLLGSGFDLSHFRQLNSGRVNIQGQANFHATGSGTLAAPTVNASLSLRNLVLSGEPAGDVDAEAVARGADLQLKLRSHFQKAELALDGSVHLRDTWPADLTLRFSQVDIDPLLRAYMHGRVTGHSSVAGNIDVRGPLLSLPAVTIQGELQQVHVDIENVRLTNDGPIRFAVANEILTLSQARVVGEGTNLVAYGSVPTGGAGAIDLHADGQANLKILQTFDPDLVAYGVTSVGLNVKGSLTRPMLNGRVEIANAGISYIDLPNGLSNINGALVFTENRLQVQSLTAHTGGGKLDLGGFIAYENGVYFNLTARGKDVRLRYPPGVSAVADADLRFAGTLTGSTLSGDVTVTKVGLNPRFDFALYLARSNQPPAALGPDSPLNGVRFDVHIVSTPELQVQTSLARVSGDADLRLRGTAARPVVLGRANIVEGDIFFNSTKYHLERGDILFANPIRIEPALNMEASARVRDVDVTLGFHGPIDKLSTTYRSDPPLATGDIIALLALGRAPGDPVTNTQPQPNLTETATNALLGQALNATISSRVQRLFGVSRIKIDPQVAGPENNGNARLTVEQQVSNKVTLTYITNLSQSAQQVIQGEVQVTKNVSVIGVRDQNGVVGFDVRIRQRKR